MQISTSVNYNNGFNSYNNPYSNNNSDEETTVISLNKDDKKEAKTDKTNETNEDKTNKNGNEELTAEEEQQVSKLQARDTEVRAHEAAHLAAAGGLAAGGASFTYQKGPDGKQYAIGGEVPIDTSEGRTPEETISRMQQVKAAATAPADPSAQDMKIAATANVIEMKARQELSEEKAKETEEMAQKSYNENSQEDEEKTTMVSLDLSA